MSDFSFTDQLNSGACRQTVMGINNLTTFINDQAKEQKRVNLKDIALKEVRAECLLMVSDCILSARAVFCIFTQ